MDLCDQTAAEIGFTLFSISGLYFPYLMKHTIKVMTKRCRYTGWSASLLSSILSLMPRLHLPYDEYTMPVRCPNHRFHAAFTGRPYDHRSDLRASWLL